MFESSRTHPNEKYFEEIINDFIWGFIKTLNSEKLNKIIGNHYNDDWNAEKMIILHNIFENTFAKFCEKNNITTNYIQSIYNNYKLFRKYNIVYEFMFEINHTVKEISTDGIDGEFYYTPFKKIILVAVDYKKDVFKIFITNKENKQMFEICSKTEEFMKNTFNGKEIKCLVTFPGRIDINYKESYDINKNILIYFPIVHNSYSPYYFNIFVRKQLYINYKNFFNTKFYRNNKDKIENVLKIAEICDV